MKKRALLIAALLFLVGGASILWVDGRAAYRHYKERCSVAQAKAFMTQTDYRSASMSARKALVLNSNNLEACLIMADLSDLSRSPAVLDWRRRIADLAPTLQNRLLLASTSLRTQSKPYSIAGQTLQELADSAGNSADYHVLAAELDMKLGRRSEAITHYEAAARLEPANELHQSNLSVLRLLSTNVAVAATARSTLERLSASPEVGAVALRSLITDCLRRGDLVGAARFSGNSWPARARTWPIAWIVWAFFNKSRARNSTRTCVRSSATR